MRIRHKQQKDSSGIANGKLTIFHTSIQNLKAEPLFSIFLYQSSINLNWKYVQYANIINGSYADLYAWISCFEYI